MRVFRVGFLFEYLINNLINKKCLTKKKYNFNKKFRNNKIEFELNYKFII